MLLQVAIFHFYGWVIVHCICIGVCLYIHITSSFLFFVFLLFRAVPVAHGNSQARGRIGAAAAGLYRNHSNMGQALSVTYTTAHSNTGFLTHWARPGIKPTSSSILVRLINPWATKGIPVTLILNKQIMWLTHSELDLWLALLDLNPY